MNPASRLRVGLVSHSGGDHGAERAFVEMARALDRMGVTCSAVVPESGYVQTQLRDSGIDCVRFAYKWWAMPSTVLRRCARTATNAAVAARLAAHFRARAVDVVLTNSSVVPVGALAARALAKPHVWCVHELIGDDWVPYDFGPTQTLRWIDRWSALVVVGSKGMRARLSSRISPASRIHVIAPVFEEPARHAPLAASPYNAVELRAVIVGRIGEGKGQVDAVRAVGRLASEGFPIVLEIVGAGPRTFTWRLLREARALGLAGRVRLLGHADDNTRRARVAAADVVLVCSRDETYGRGTLEAMALGRPIVATNIPPTAELIRDGLSGLLYPVGDDAALSNAIRSVLSSPERARALGEGARTWVEQEFSAERNATNLYLVLQRAACRA